MPCDVSPGDLRWKATCRRREQVPDGASWRWRDKATATFPALFRSVRPEPVATGDREREHRVAELVTRHGADVQFDDMVDVDGQPRAYRVIGVEHPYRGRYRRWMRVHLAWPPAQEADNGAKAQ